MIVVSQQVLSACALLSAGLAWRGAFPQTVLPIPWRLGHVVMAWEGVDWQQGEVMSSSGASNLAVPVANGAPTHNLQGQAVGRKGQLTRLRLIDTLCEMLRHRPLNDLRIMELCQQAKTSPGTFYLYFKDVQDLAFEAIRLYQEIPAELDDLLRAAWPVDSAFQYAQRFVAGYVHYWQERYHLLQIRNLTADQGDGRMVELRHSCVVPIMEHLAEKIASAQRRDAGPLTPLAGATVVMGSLERLVALSRFHVAPRGDMSTQELIDAEAWVLARMLGQDEFPAAG